MSSESRNLSHISAKITRVCVYVGVSSVDNFTKQQQSCTGEMVNCDKKHVFFRQNTTTTTAVYIQSGQWRATALCSREVILLRI